MSRNFQGVGKLLIVLAFVSGIGGCGGGEAGPALHPVSGVVTHNGTPLAKVMIKFMPVAGGTFSSAMTDDQGKFTLQYTMDKAGAIAGENVVYIEYMPRTPEEESQAGFPNFKPPAPYGDVVAKYGTKEASSYKVNIDGPKENLEVKLD